jgi:hypothetical protein
MACRCDGKKWRAHLRRGSRSLWLFPGFACRWHPCRTSSPRGRRHVPRAARGQNVTPFSSACESHRNDRTWPEPADLGCCRPRFSITTRTMRASLASSKAGNYGFPTYSLWGSPFSSVRCLGVVVRTKSSLLLEPSVSLRVTLSEFVAAMAAWGGTCATGFDSRSTFVNMYDLDHLLTQRRADGRSS